LRSTSCKQIAGTLLQRCIAGHPPKELPPALLEEPCAEALFGILVEGLADRFEPALCDAYARLFSQAIVRASNDADPASLVARYERVRRVRLIAGRPERIFVLSRVTLGADVAVTSVLLSAARRGFPRAEITFVGPHKNFELFSRDRRIHHALLEYPRGGLRERLVVHEPLEALFAAPGAVVIDSDSRLTQLGLLPVCSEERYHLFESRGYGGASGRTLPDLAASWARETIGVFDAKPYVAMHRAKGVPLHGDPYVAVSLGVGENPTKRLPDPFEEQLLALLAQQGKPLWIDKGAGGEEAQRVERAVERSGVKANFWEGSFAGFAAIISGASLYVGYDSAGQHVAAARGIPLISIFAGFPAPRMFERWRPEGPCATVIRVERPDPREVLHQVRAAFEPPVE